MPRSAHSGQNNPDKNYDYKVMHEYSQYPAPCRMPRGAMRGFTTEDFIPVCSPHILDEQ